MAESKNGAGKGRVKKIIAICAVVLVAAVTIGVWSQLPHPISYGIAGIGSVGGSRIEVLERGQDQTTVRLNGDEPIKILMFTDTHLDGKNATSKVTVAHIVENIQKEKPDLVLFGGDNVTSGLNAVRCRQVGKIFENLGVYWGGMLGNHEGDNPWSVKREKMMDIFTSFDHCLMRKGADGIDGWCNYALNIEDADGNNIHTFFFLDTFDELNDEQKAACGLDPAEDYYDGVHENQIEWYTGKVSELRGKYGDFKSSIVTHIPVPQMEQEAEKGKFLWGGKLEGVCASGYDWGLFDAAKSAGSTKTFFCGHDHLNNFGLEYEGIILTYIEPSGYGSYTTASRLGYEEKDWLQGYSRVTIGGGEMKIEQIRNSEGMS